MRSIDPLTKTDFRRDRAVRLLENLPDLSFDGSVELALTREFLIPEQTGVYLMHDVRGVLYVGRTKNLRRRFVQHERLRRNRLLRLAMSRPVGSLTFSWILVPPGEPSAALERRLIARFQPVCNRLLLDTPLA